MIEYLPVTVRQPVGIASLLVAAVLPVLLVLLLLAAWRTWREARRLRAGSLRLSLAQELDISPRELTNLSVDSLLKLRDQLAFDELTGVLRRAAGIAALEREMRRSRRQKTPLSVAFVDVDGLKQVNDLHGHAAGDKLLIRVVDNLRERLRGNDLIFRFGGDEFVCVLPEASPLDCEKAFVEIRSRAAEAGASFTFGSAGMQDRDDPSTLLARADTRLYDTRFTERGSRSSRDDASQVFASRPDLAPEPAAGA